MRFSPAMAQRRPCPARSLHSRPISVRRSTPQPHGIAGAALGLFGIFLPGILILIGTLPFWDAFRTRAGAQAVMRGVNAAVVGLLGAALYNPVWTTSVKSSADFAVALVCFVLLVAWRAPPLVVVLVSACAGIALALI